MNSIVYIVIFGLAGILFLAAGILVFRPLRQTSRPGEWVILAAAFIVLAGLAGVQIYQQAAGAPSATLTLVSGVLALGAAILACSGAFTIGSRILSERQSQASAQGELERYRLSFEKEPQYLVIKDRQGVYITTNPAYAQLLGKKDQNLAGESDFNFFPRSQASAFRQEEEQAIESGAPQTRDEEIHAIDGEHWLRITRIPLQDESNSALGILIAGQDITAQKKAEAALDEWNQGLTTLYESEMALEQPTDLAPAIESMLVWAGKLAGTVHVGLWQIAPERSTAVLKAGTGKLSRLVGVQLKTGEDIAWKVWQGSQAVLVNDYQSWPQRAAWGREAGFFSALGAPLKIKGQVTGVLTLFHDKAGQPFREQQVQILSLFAQVAASRLQNAELVSGCQGELAERQQALVKIQYRARLEHVVAVLAAHFIILDPEKVDEGISRSLQTLARFTGVDQCYLALYPRQETTALSQTAWYSSGSDPAEEARLDFSGEEFQWYLGKLNQSETIHIPRLGDLPAEAEEAAAYLQTRGIKSFTAIPLVSNRSMIGYLGFETRHAELEWSQDVLALLKVSSEMFVNLLERKAAAKAVKETQEKTSRQITALEQRNRETATITEMGDLLQACRTADEAYPIVTRFAQRLIPASSGALYMIHDAKDPAENVAVWGNTPPGPAEHELAPNECWSLRRGRIYVVQDPSTEPLCGHLKDSIQAGYMCVPLLAQGTAVGVLHLRLDPDQAETGAFNENQQRLAGKVAEYIAMTLTNLKLRDELRSQAIRDPLTRLFNRRYMEETLEREIRRANRHSTAVGIIMFDIDKMKPINDQFGHDAGDLVLKSLGKELLSMFRGEDVACRYGGDEFTIVLPEASLADVWRRAEQMRDAVRRLDLVYEGKHLGPLTLSIGVAAYPDHGATTERVLLASDAASYASKSEGGDRIMMGHQAEG